MNTLNTRKTKHAISLKINFTFNNIYDLTLQDDDIKDAITDALETIELENINITVLDPLHPFPYIHPPLNPS